MWDSGDGSLKGFGIRVKPSGAASYIVQYRNKSGHTRRLRLGRVGTLTPTEARNIAADVLREVAKGADPSADRHAACQVITVGELCDRYLGDVAGRIKPSTLAMDRSPIERHVKPLIGRRIVSDIALQDVEWLQAQIASGKTAIERPRTGRTGETRGGRGVASRSVRFSVYQ